MAYTTGAWNRPTDFSSGSVAGTAYVLTLSGMNNEGTSWVCNTPTAIIDTDPITFAQFSLPSQTTAANIGSGTGQLFAYQMGNVLNFKTIATGTHLTAINNASDVTLVTDATSADTPSTIIARDASGNFSASVMTGTASANVLKTGDTMTGNLNFADQAGVLFQDSTGDGNYVGLNAPAVVSSSYIVNLPASAPTAGQVLQATSAGATTWAL